MRMQKDKNPSQPQARAIYLLRPIVEGEGTDKKKALEGRTVTMGKEEESVAKGVTPLLVWRKDAGNEGKGSDNGVDQRTDGTQGEIEAEEEDEVHRWIDIVEGITAVVDLLLVEIEDEDKAITAQGGINAEEEQDGGEVEVGVETGIGIDSGEEDKEIEIGGAVVHRIDHKTVVTGIINMDAMEGKKAMALVLRLQQYIL